MLCLAGTTVSLQQTLVVALLPSFAELFAISADDASWLITATLLTSAVATPVVARLADMYGKRLMMIVCILLMACGSLVAALSAGSFAVLIVGRALQGFSAALIPVGISIMRDELPKEQVSSAIALMSATLGIGGALGLPLGGLLFGRFGWSSVFWLSVVVGLAILVAVIVVVPESGVKTRGRFDLLGALLLSAALTCLLLVISKGASWGGESVALLLTATAVLLAVWFPYSLQGQPAAGRPAHLGASAGAVHQPGLDPGRLRPDGEHPDQHPAAAAARRRRAGTASARWRPVWPWCPVVWPWSPSPRCRGG